MCVCAPTQWLQPADSQSCKVCPNPCSLGGDDACGVKLDGRNLCSPESVFNPLESTGRRLTTHLGAEQLGTGTCAGFRCTCAPGFLSSNDGKSCTPCPNPCAGVDPCRNRDDGRNICVPDFQTNIDTSRTGRGLLQLPPGTFGVCGSFTCQCGGDGFKTAADAKSCELCADPCRAGDPCATQAGSGNMCFPAWTPQYTSTTAAGGGRGGRRLQQSAPGVGSVFPANPAPNARPNGVAPNYFNPSTQIFATQTSTTTYQNNCDKFRCECNAAGYIANAGGNKCEKCTDPCNSPEDPCNLRFGPDNKCIRTNSAINIGFLASDPQHKCGGFTCQCGTGFVSSTTGQSCEPCPNPCLGRDPCNQAKHPMNRCVPELAVGTRPVAIGRRLASHMVQNDNSVVFFQGSQCGGYTCQCAGPLAGWVAPPEATSCTPCSNPCATGDPCSSQMDPRNVCIPAAANPLILQGGSDGCGVYTCRCNGLGFVLAPGSMSCRTCPNPCSFGDPCNTRSDSNNVCIPTLQSAINVFGRRLMDSADGDDVALGKTGRGLLSPFYNSNLGEDGCGSYSCRCRGVGYEPGPLRQSCVVSPGSGCPDPCSNKDPCNRAGNSANQCINQAQVQCGYYECACASGWQSVQRVITQGPTCEQALNSVCPTFSSSYDPCLTLSTQATNTCSASTGTWKCVCDPSGTNGSWASTNAQECKMPGTGR